MASTTGSPSLDRLDRQIIHALMLHGRCPFARIAAVLDSSEQTIARRYRRLHDAGVIHVRGIRAAVEPMHDWYVRVGVRPGAAAALAAALAARDDVFWVTITAGGAEVVCATQPRTPEQREQRDALLLDRLPRATHVTSLTAHAILHRYAGGGVNEWTAFDDPLEPGQITALSEGRPRLDATVAGRHRAPVAVLEPDDALLAAALHEDGRAGYAQLAAITGWSPSRAARRLDALLASGALYIDVEVATEPLGFSALAMFWLTVAPSGLADAAQRLAAARETAFVAAVSGPANLLAAVACRNTPELYDFLIGEIGALKAVHTVETSPAAHRVKQAGSLMRGRRLAVSRSR